MQRLTSALATGAQMTASMATSDLVKFGSNTGSYNCGRTKSSPYREIPPIGGMGIGRGERLRSGFATVPAQGPLDPGATWVRGGPSPNLCEHPGARPAAAHPHDDLEAG